MIQTILAVLVFTVLAVWWTGRPQAASRAGTCAPLITPRFYVALLVLGLLLALLWS